MVAHAFNPSTREAEAGKFEAIWSIELVPGQPGLHREICLEKNKQQQKQKINSFIEKEFGFQAL